MLADARLGAVVIPVTIAITIGLFWVQRGGTAAMGRWFGPVMLLWFASIALLGVGHVVGNPGVLAAVNPAYAAAMVGADPWRAFLTMGTVVLTITGAEALYADMGHFGRRPISRAWLWLVLPALLLCYAGQAALLLARPATVEQLFFLMAPAWALWPLLALATLATVIASQSAITGAFSITAQAIQLGYLPRLAIRHTSAEERGQVFAPAVNVVLCLAVIGLVLGFGSSTALAAAFGFAVTATMVLTSLLMGFVIFRVWRWNPLWAAPLCAVLFAFDLALFAASATKIMDGAWLPLAIAAVLMLLFATWARGRGLLARKLAEGSLPLPSFCRSAGPRAARAGPRHLLHPRPGGGADGAAAQPQAPPRAA